MLFIAANEKDFEEKLAVARKIGIGIELAHFTSYESLYSRKKISDLRKKVKGVPIVVHAPYDMFDVSGDRIVRKTVMKHCRRVLKIAKKFGARRVIFHTRFASDTKSEHYTGQFTENAADFFSKLKGDVEIAVENVRETPALLKTIIPADKKICLDVGHLNIYSKYPLSAWIKEFGDKITYVHLHNNSGKSDEHTIDGVMDLAGIAKHFKCDVCIETFGKIEKIEDLARRILKIS